MRLLPLSASSGSVARVQPGKPDVLTPKKLAFAALPAAPPDVRALLTHSESIQSVSLRMHPTEPRGNIRFSWNGQPCEFRYIRTLEAQEKPASCEMVTRGDLKVGLGGRYELPNLGDAELLRKTLLGKVREQMRDDYGYTLREDAGEFYAALTEQVLDGKANARFEPFQVGKIDFKPMSNHNLPNLEGPFVYSNRAAHFPLPGGARLSLVYGMIDKLGSKMRIYVEFSRPGRPTQAFPIFGEQNERVVTMPWWAMLHKNHGASKETIGKFREMIAEYRQKSRRQS